jgi:hypothetical protein
MLRSCSLLKPWGIYSLCRTVCMSWNLMCWWRKSLKHTYKRKKARYTQCVRQYLYILVVLGGLTLARQVLYCLSHSTSTVLGIFKLGS